MTRSSSESDVSRNNSNLKCKNCDVIDNSDENSNDSPSKCFTSPHRRRSWPPKVNDDSDYFMFDEEENKKPNYADALYCLNNKDMEIKSRVKERIEDFENNKQVCGLFLIRLI